MLQKDGGSTIGCSKKADDSKKMNAPKTLMLPKKCSKKMDDSKRRMVKKDGCSQKVDDLKRQMLQNDRWHKKTNAP